jgi:hypothetical protein
MPILENARHERYAQELAKGKTANEAYALAGYVPNGKNASRLKGNEGVQTRVEEILRKAAIRTELTVARLTEDLLRIARKGEALKEGSGLSVARQATMDAAKLNGLIMERQEVGRPGDFSRMSDEELDAFITAGLNSYVAYSVPEKPDIPNGQHRKNVAALRPSLEARPRNARS